MTMNNMLKEKNSSIQTHDDNTFTPLLVSTTTVTAVIGMNINIIDIAKYLPLDSFIIGIKLVYAGGSQTIIRGASRISKKKKDFYNQVTFTLRLPAEYADNKISSILVSCKIFHNGTLHVTGTHTLEEAKNASNLLMNRLNDFKGIRMISIDKDYPYLKTKDNLIISSSGTIIGWSDPLNKIMYVNNEYVVLDTFGDDDQEEDGRINVFISAKWNNNNKTVYDLDGNVIGKKLIHFDTEISKRHFEVKFGYVYCGNKIVGKEVTEIKGVNNFEADRNSEKRNYFIEKGAVLHPFVSYEKQRQAFEKTDFTTHMINTFFKAPFKVCRKRLHKTFLDNGYYSRFDPCSHAAVNLRFHYNDSTKDNKDQNGKCIYKSGVSCRCKDISISIFNSGKMNITGLATLEQGDILYSFLKDFFLLFKNEIVDTSLE